jgi:cytochrome c2
MQRKSLIGLGLVACLLAVPTVGSAEQAASQTQQVRRGWQVFNEKQCAACHAVWGEGESFGPDLGRTKTGFLSAGQLAGVMWNHAPEMWSRMASRGIPIEEISGHDMESLFSFLYFIRFMDEPGNALRGEELASRKKCALCHATRPDEVKSGPSFRTMGGFANPIMWAQKMWNHTPAMYREMFGTGVGWPTFEGDEMVDLIAFVDSIADATDRVYLEPGDRDRGRKAFDQRGCGNCHESERATYAPQLGALARQPRTIGQMAGLMWNHAPEMVELADSAGIEWTSITSQEMADLIAYFFSIRFYREDGDVARGEKVFFEKNCNICHAQSGIARNLSDDQDGISPIQMAQFMWDHGVEMLQKMEELRVPWPTFENNELVDLLAYMNAEARSVGRPPVKK